MESPTSTDTSSKGSTPERQSLFTLYQWLYIGAGLVVLVLLFFAEKTPPLKNQAARDTTGSPPTPADAPVSSAVNTPTGPVLESAVQERVAKLEQELTAARSRKDSLSALDRLVTSFSEVNRPDLALRPQELYYKLEPSAAMRLKTAQLYKEASMLPFLTEDNPVLEGNLKRRSSTLYDEHLKAYPKDLDAQIDRAMVNILPDNPMQGIRQLLTLAEENPGNARVSLELGKFALKSGQFDKAETRLSKAASLEANNWEAHFYLALAQERLDKKKEARSAFEKALALAPNAPLKEMIQAQLTNLRP